jgi:hypothetical protein
LAGITFFTLDALIFRPSIYARLLTTLSAQSNFAHDVSMEKSRLPSGKREVLLIGDSRMNAAFDPQEFVVKYPKSTLQPIQVSREGASARSWYYALPKIDPSQNRYEAIVIPLEGYEPTPRVEDFADAPLAAPIQEVSEWLPLGRSQDAPEPGTANIEDLRIGYRDGKIIAAPKHFSPSQIHEVEALLVPSDGSSAQVRAKRFLEYHLQWYGKIIELYAHSQTRIIFVYMPHEPFPIPSLTPLISAPDFRKLLPNPGNVVFLDSNNYMDLESPEYFYDIRHLNKAGSMIFTNLIAEQLAQALPEREK